MNIGIYLQRITIKNNESMTASNKMDDKVLWDLLIKGDQKAWEILYQRYYLLLLNYGLRCSTDRELVKDCIQDLFINLYQNTRINVTSVTVRSYLLRALRNNLTYKLMSDKEADSLDNSVFHIPVNEDLFDQLFPKNDRDVWLAHRLLEAISQLSPNQKTVLYLRYVEDLSYREIADVMNMNIQSSMNLSSRALAKLRSLMVQDACALGVCQLFLIKIVLSIK